MKLMARFNDLDNYQRRAVDFAVYPSGHVVVYPTLGLTGEAGEVAEKVKKIIRDHGGVDKITAEKRDELAKELGDVLWYLANLAYDLGFSLDHIAEMNIEKLTDRMNRNKLHGEGDQR